MSSDSQATKLRRYVMRMKGSECGRAVLSFPDREAAGPPGFGEIPRAGAPITSGLVRWLGTSLLFCSLSEVLEQNVYEDSFYTLFSAVN
jgi:hypothetical protein